MNALVSKYHCSRRGKRTPNLKYDIRSRYVDCALNLFGMTNSVFFNIDEFRKVLKNRFRIQCKNLHPDSQQKNVHGHPNGTGFNNVVHKYKALKDLDYIPLPDDLIEMFININSFSNPDSGFDINQWVSPRKMISL